MGEIMDNLDKESQTKSEFNFSELPGMNCGKMMKLTEVMGNYLGHSSSVLGFNTGLYTGMISTLYENESRMSGIEDLTPFKQPNVAMSLFQSPLSVGNSVMLGDKVTHTLGLYFLDLDCSFSKEGSRCKRYTF